MEVTAVCNTKNLELIKSLGADELIDYTKEDFTRCGEVFDYVFDAVGKSSYCQCRNLLKKGGLYFSTDLGPFMQNPLLALWTKIFGSLPSGKKVVFPFPEASKENVLFFKKIIEEGKYKAVIDKYYSFNEIVEATKYVESGQKTGNVVIKMSI